MHIDGHAQNDALILFFPPSHSSISTPPFFPIPSGSSLATHQCICPSFDPHFPTNCSLGKGITSIFSLINGKTLVLLSATTHTYIFAQLYLITVGIQYARIFCSLNCKLCCESVDNNLSSYAKNWKKLWECQTIEYATFLMLMQNQFRIKLTVTAKKLCLPILMQNQFWD